MEIGQDGTFGFGADALPYGDANQLMADRPLTSHLTDRDDDPGETRRTP